eukprot:1188612-Prorocentrum_minimum.AAC.1
MGVRGVRGVDGGERAQPDVGRHRAPPAAVLDHPQPAPRLLRQTRCDQMRSDVTECASACAPPPLHACSAKPNVTKCAYLGAYLELVRRPECTRSAATMAVGSAERWTASVRSA